MTKEFGGSAGLLALLGLFVHLQVPHSDKGLGSQQDLATPVEASSDKSEHEHVKEEPIEGPWLATEASFGVSSSSRSLHKFENSSNFRKLIDNLTVPEGEIDKQALCHLLGIPANQEEGSSKRFAVIATVADPSHTHLALFLDEQTEAIERSVQSLGWQFTAQWLPWADYFNGAVADINGRRVQRRLQREQEEMPGILIFRGEHRVKNSWPSLFVFLVPETVTGGINIRSFHAAMHMARILAPQHEIGLLAPTFSGSFASLAIAVGQWKSSVSGTVYSGSASNNGYADSFKQITKLQFHGGVFNSDDYKDAVCKLLGEYGFSGPEQKAALLKEDEGGFQQSLSHWIESKEAQCYETYVFPRDISHLRNAYKDNSANTVQNPYSDVLPRLSFTIQDPNRGEDSIPTFSQTQTPLSQEAVLADITGEINRAHIHIALISATNRLDALFLLRALRVSCPDTRVLVDHPSMLFVSAAGQEALTGTIFLSSYPMFFRGESWLGEPDDRDRIAFPDSAIEGLYNVTQFLLKDIGAAAELKLHSYQQPKKDYPGVWVLTLTRNGFFPIDLRINEDAKWLKSNPNAKLTPLPTSLDKLPSRGWLFTILIVFIANLLLCLTFFRVNFHDAGPLWLNVIDNQTPKLGAFLTATLSLSGLMWVLAWPWWNAQLSGTGLGFSARVITLKTLMLGGWLMPLGLLALVVFILFQRRLIQQTGWHHAVSYALPVLFYGFVLKVWYLLCAREATGLFFRFRSVELYSGSSPALPVSIALLTFCLIALFDLKRYGLAGAARSRLHINDGSDKFRQGLRSAYQQIEYRMTSSSSLGLRDSILRVLPGVGLIAVCVLILGKKSLSAFEASPYNGLLLTAVGLIILSLAVQSYDLQKLWAGARYFLDLVQIHPQRRRFHAAIARISRHWPKRTIWSLNRTVTRGALEREMLYRLDWRAGAFPMALSAAAGSQADNIVRNEVSDQQKEADEFRQLLVSGSHGTEGIDRLAQIEKLKRRCAELAGEIYDRDLEWGRTTDTGPEKTPENGYEAHCEDFVALQLCQFVQYLVDQIKRMAVSLSLSFVLLIVLFNSYSPESPQLVARLLAVMFLLMGILVWRIFSQLERDPVLSLIGNTKSGQLSGEFWTQLASLGSLPLLGVLGHLFPSVTQFLFQWIAPGVQQLH